MFLVLAAIAWLAGFSALQAPAPQIPTFHAATHLVQISVVVKDKAGAVSDLTRKDFVITDNGKAQQIGVFSLNSDRSIAASLQPLPRNTFSDLPQYTAPVPNGVTVILLDNLNTLTGGTPLPYEDTPLWMENLALANGKQHLVEYVQRLAPANRVALYSLRDRLHVLCDFTCGRDQLLAVLRKYDSSSQTHRDIVEPAPIHIPNAPEMSAAATVADQRHAQVANQVRYEQTVAALMGIAAHLADVPGRKNLLWLTANLPFSAQQIARIFDRSDIAVYPIDVRGLLPRAAGETSAKMYSGDEVITGSEEIAKLEDVQPTGIAAMQKIAEQTGGRAFVNTNDLTDAIRTAVDDASVSYTVGFYVSPDSLDGKFHALKVVVKRPGVTVRSPKLYFAAKDEPAELALRRNRLDAAVTSPLQSSAIPVFARFEKPGQPKPDTLRVVGVIDIRKLQFAEQASLHKAAVEVAVVQQDAAGKVLNQSDSTLHLEFSAGHFASALRSGVLFRKSIQPQPGLATLRVVVEDPVTAQTGSIIVPLSQIH